MELALTVFGRTVTLSTKGLQLSPLSSHGGWWPIVREPFTGAWQRDVSVSASSALTYSAVFACVTLIASDIAKLRLRLVKQDAHGIWTEAENPAWTPFLRKPNRYQTRIKFIEQWISSKLIHGNTYVLKQRDARGIVTAGYVLDPMRVTPLVTPDGAVYYQLRRDDLSGLALDTVIVPAREIIHDTMVCLYHPLIGVSPIYACGVAALQGLSIQGNSQKFFDNLSMPGGMLTAPGEIKDETALRLKADFETRFSGDNIGKLLVAGSGLEFKPFTMSAVDAQLIEQLKWTAETVCSVFHIQPYMVSIGPPPPYANIEPLNLQYYSQCLQSPIENLELCLDEGLELPRPYGTEFDLTDLIRMDTATRMAAANTAIGAGMSPNEARKRFYDLGPVKGGETPYLQAQYYALSTLAERDAKDPFAKPAPQAVPPPRAEDEDDDATDMAASFTAALRRKSLERWPRAA